MSNIIKDGTGDGHTAGVDSQNRLKALATAETIAQSALSAGRSFLTSTGIIELTTDTPTAIYYLKNTGDSNLLSISASLFVGPSDGTGIIEYTFVGNATDGTIIDSAVDAVSLNLNGSSTNILDADLYKGVQGDTLIGGGRLTILLPKAEGVYTQFSQTVLPKGASGAVLITPPPGNTSMKVCLDIEHILTDFI